jgi:DNA invertase Pin-like site-specific DNA recombinase
MDGSASLFVWQLERLGRDLKHLIDTVDDPNKQDVGFKVLAGAGAQIDTTTANGRLIFCIIETQIKNTVSNLRF